MLDYRRYRLPGGTYFFTVNLLQRYPNDLLVCHIDILRTVLRAVRQKRPFLIDAWVVLPDHLHCVWTLPPGDDDFTNRRRLIKQGFSKALLITERRSAVRMARGERGIWQCRFLRHAQDRFGNMLYAVTSIMPRILIIRLNMTMYNELLIGLIQPFATMLSVAFILWIGLAISKPTWKVWVEGSSRWVMTAWMQEVEQCSSYC